SARVYIIGHAGRGDISFSFQDNELLDHEGPPDGQPQIPGVCRVHYRAATEGGSSGSPVFDHLQWRVIAMHHRGGRLGRLNGKPGNYGANEGISIQSIIEAIPATPALRVDLVTPSHLEPSGDLPARVSPAMDHEIIEKLVADLRKSILPPA